jgi:polar amino acid transport system substrate-binding protein
MVKMLLTLACSVFLLFSAGAAADAAGYPEKLHVVYMQWYPYTYKDGMDARGFEIETFKAVMDKMGVKVVFEQFPFKRCLKMLETGTADAAVSVLDTPERRRYIIFPQEYISISRTLFFTGKDSKIRYGGSLEELKGYNIGVIAGFSYGKGFDNARHLKKEAVVDPERLVNMVLGGRCDLGIENQAVIKGIAKELGVERSIRFLGPPVHAQKLYVGFSRAGHLEKLASDFSNALREFKKTDHYKAILRKYGISYQDMVHRSEKPGGD